MRPVRHGDNGLSLNGNPEEMHCKLAVIGAGLAGISAAIFASNRSIDTLQFGTSSEIGFSSGCLDLFAIDPFGENRPYADPFKGISALLAQVPNHPYAGITRAEISRGFKEFKQFMSGAGIDYHCENGVNQQIITPAGTLKSTYCVPMSMVKGARAVAQKQRILIADIKGLKGFGARQIAEHLKPHLPGIQSVTLTFPGKETASDLLCERLGWDLEKPEILDRFAEQLGIHAQKVDAVGLPAILGVYRFEAVRQHLEKRLGKHLFEIPTLAPSVTGMRLKEAFINHVPKTGIRHFPVSVNRIDMNGSGGFSFDVTQGFRHIAVETEYLLLATGRFLGRGLGVEDGLIKERLMGLPVTQPKNRSGWYRRDFFDPRGHGVNRAGIETDDRFRPLDQSGRVFHPRLFAAGSLLAHQDWKREKSGAGISIASAMKAVSAIAEKEG